MYQKYSPNLDLLLSDCFNKHNSFIYTFDFNDVLFDSGSNIIMVGTVGNNMAWMNGMFTWYTLAVTKAGKVNSNPVFVNKDLKKKVLPGDTAILNSPAIDYDNDSITYEIVTPYSWIESYNIPGSFLISPSVSDTGHYQIFLRALDKNNGSDTNIVSLIIGNKPPQIISTPDTLVLLNTNYAYKLIAKDPDDEITFYRISDGPSWLKTDSSGVLSGKPMQQSDTGFYEIKVVAYDEYNGEDMQTYLLHVKSDNSNGIDEIKQRDENILVYPVPSGNFLYLRLTTSIVIKAKIKILSLSGTLIREYQIKEVNDKEILQLEISGINPGIYMLLVTYDGSFLLKKIIIL